MIQKILSKITTESSTTSETLIAINAIKILLDEIDFASEIIPLEDPHKLIELLVFIKGSALTIAETGIAIKIIQN